MRRMLSIASVVIICSAAFQVPFADAAPDPSGPGDRFGEAPPKKLQRDASMAPGLTQATTDPDGGVVYRVDGGFDLDSYLCDGHLGWQIDIADDYGPVTADGQPSPGNQLYGKTALVTLRTYDVDAVDGEVDHLYVNGSHVEPNLSGANDQWSTNTYRVPTSLLRLSTPANPEGTNDFYIDIDVTDAGWCVEVDYVELRPGTTPVLPVVFAHGITSHASAMTAAENYFHRREPKTVGRTIKPEMTFNGTVQRNAELMATDIDTLLTDEPVQKVDIVTHSMGGLDARLYAYTHPGKVRTVVMLGTPNGGSELADLLCGSSSLPWWAGTAIQQAAFRQFGSCFGSESGLFQLQEFFVQGVFNRVVSDLPGVHYYTVAGTKGRFGTSAVLAGQDDGAVAVSSVKWLDQANRAHPGRHINLADDVYLAHDELKQTDSALAIAFAGVYSGGRYSGGGGGGGPGGGWRHAELHHRPGVEDRLETGDLTNAGGIAGKVPAGKTRSYPVAVGSAEAATLLAVAPPGLKLEIGPVTGRPTTLFDQPATSFEFQGPKTLRVTNTSTKAKTFLGFLLADGDRALTLDNPGVVTAGRPATLTARVSGATSTDVVSYKVVDDEGAAVANGTMIEGGGDTWQAEVAGLSGGSFQVTVWIAGDRPRVAAAPLLVAAGASIGELSSETPSDPDGDGGYDALHLAVEVDVDYDGTYVLGGAIRAADGALVTTVSSEPTTIPAGPTTIDLTVDGLDLGNSRHVGPWHLGDLVLTDDTLAVAASKANVGTLAFSDFSQYEHDALSVGEFEDALGDVDGDSHPDTLDVTFDVDVVDAGRYAFNGRLTTLDGTEVARAQDERPFASESSSVMLSFDGSVIAESGLDGPYLLSDFSVYPLDAPSGGVSLVNAHQTGRYEAAEFDPTTRPAPTAAPIEVTGGGRVGTPLAATPVVWTPETIGTEYQWFRVDEFDGRTLIDGADTFDYTVTADDLGYSLLVAARVKVDGQLTGRTESLPIPVRPAKMSTSTRLVAPAEVAANTRGLVKAKVLAGAQRARGKVRFHVVFGPDHSVNTRTLHRGVASLRLPAKARGRFRVWAVYPGNKHSLRSVSRRSVVMVVRRP
jgi:pimeloyl-ACP methyl ester carboxylesterase